MTRLYVAKLIDARLHGGHALAYSTISQADADACAARIRDAVVGGGVASSSTGASFRVTQADPRKKIPRNQSGMRPKRDAAPETPLEAAIRRAEARS